VKIFLDDEREAPNGWTRCYWPQEVIALYEQYGKDISIISLDHDLGDDTKGTGYTFLEWLEHKVDNDPSIHIPTIMVHTQNSGAALKMRAALMSIKRLSDNWFTYIMAPFNPNLHQYGN
jgi:hypothetical protein